MTPITPWTLYIVRDVSEFLSLVSQDTPEKDTAKEDKEIWRQEKIHVFEQTYLKGYGYARNVIINFYYKGVTSLLRQLLRCAAFTL